MSELGKFTIRPVGVYGVQRESSIDSQLIPQGGIVEAVNFNFDRIGAATVRPGMTRIGGTMSGIGGTIVALYNAGGSAMLVANYLGNVWATPVEGLGSQTWAATTLNGSIKTRFVDLGDYVLGIPAGSPPTSRNMLVARYPYKDTLAASGGGSTGNPFNINQFTGKAHASFGENYKSRIYLGGNIVKPNRLYFSSVIDSEGNISWNPDFDFVDVNPGDGDVMTGLKRFLLDLLVFKRNLIYRFRTTGLDPDPMIKVGTRNHESIVEGKRGLYFHHLSGFYRHTGGVTPVEISRPIADIVDAITVDQAENIGGWRDNDHIYWSVGGNITVGGPRNSTIFKNVVFRYTESSEAWTVYEYPYAIGRGSAFVSNTVSSIAIGPNTPLTGGGLNSGFVAEFNRGTVDATISAPVSINYRMITKWYEWGGTETRKFIEQIAIIAEKGMGMNVMYQVDEDDNWQTINPDLRKLVTIFTVPTKRFNRIRFKIAGVSKDESAVFLGLDVIKGTNEGVIK